MKIKYPHCLALIALVILQNPLFAQFYKIMEAAPGTVGTAINNRGQITGQTYPSPGVFLTDKNKDKPAMTLIGNSGGDLGRSINDAGSVAGSLFDRPILWDGVKTIDLGGFGGDFGCAWGINKKGEVVGVSYLPGNMSFRAFHYANGVISDIGSLGGSSAEAHAINDRGQIVGSSDIFGDTEHHAFIYENNEFRDIGVPGFFSDARAINNHGLVVGFVTFDGFGRAFTHLDGETIILQTLGGDSCAALGVNDRGEVVGYSYLPENSGSAAFLYKNGKMVNLNDCIPEYSGWDLAGAWAINNKGQITGYGMKAGRTNWSAFILTPTSKREE